MGIITFSIIVHVKVKARNVNFKARVFDLQEALLASPLSHLPLIFLGAKINVTATALVLLKYVFTIWIIAVP